jgi:hypothetical protein
VSERERLRKEDPVRTAPIRNWSTLYRRSDSWDLREPSAPSKPADEIGGESLSDVVTHAVDLGYRVIEEQISQGQRLAEQLNSRSYDPGAMGGDLREVADRTWRYFTDLGALWVDFLSSLAGNGDLVRSLFAAWQRPSESSTSASTNGAIAVSIEVLCARPARVTLDLRSHSDRMPLVCQALRALDAEKPPLTDVGFDPGPDGLMSLRVRVPEAHPPGIYVGAVIDADTGQPRGTLSVKLA